ncbi:MAG TPA: MauE/DoxX family redox-associated membrane protein [Candidatus Eisenbacteria bacterium]|nr:MauE/DoxX family redox-associated membrane protein [Candidatus Eisenbacteria bacterium]
MDPVVDLTVRSSLALLFALAAAHKLRDLAGFRATFADYRIVPEALAPAGATLVVASEVGSACLLLLPGWRQAGLLVAIVLLGAYAAAIGVNLARGRRHIDCGCGGPAGRQPISGWLVARNLAVVFAALACLGPVSTRPLVWVDVLTIGAGVLALAAVYGAADRLIANLPAVARARGVA